MRGWWRPFRRGTSPTRCSCSSARRRGGEAEIAATRATSATRIRRARRTPPGEAYPVEELLDDLLRVGGGQNRLLAQLVVEESCSVADWMTAHGVRWQAPLTGTLHLGRTNRFFLGGGKALVNTYYQTAEAMGVEVEYDASVEDVVLDAGSGDVTGWWSTGAANARPSRPERLS